MSGVRRHKGWVIAIATALILGIASLIGVAGCGGSEAVSTTAAASQAGPPTTAVSMAALAPAEERDTAGSSIDQAIGGTLGALQAGSDQKIITTAQLDIEVEGGKFQSAFSQALLMADQYGGYVASSNSQATGAEDSMKSGTVTIRVPVGSFGKALNEAGKLGEIKNQYITTEDVTEEYVDLQARITNSEANVQRLLELLGRAQTVSEVLQVQQVVTSAQSELEQLKGRQRYLDAHTSYSTLTMNIYEAGVEVTVEPPPGEWGFVSALKDALHNFIDAISGIVRGLGWLIPILVIIAIVLFIIYLTWRRVTQRDRTKGKAGYQPYPPKSGSGGPGARVPYAPQGQPVSAPSETPDTGGHPGGKDPS